MITITIGDLREGYYLTKMNFRMDFDSFVDSYKMDDNYEVIDDEVCSIDPYDLDALKKAFNIK